MGSEARGCFIAVSYPNGTHYKVANSTRREAEIELSTQLPAHCYDVHVYDWEEDGTMGELAIPVSAAVWNDSCSIHTPPPTSESGTQKKGKMLLKQGKSIDSLYLTLVSNALDSI